MAAPNQAQMQIQMALQERILGDLRNKFMRQCWSVCYDTRLDVADLEKAAVPDAKMKEMGKCQHKCMARHFEVLRLMNAAREQREKEAALGLPPGSLNGQM